MKVISIQLFYNGIAHLYLSKNSAKPSVHTQNRLHVLLSSGIQVLSWLIRLLEEDFGLLFGHD